MNRSTSLLGTAGSIAGSDPLRKWVIIRRVLVVGAFVSSTFVLLPYTMHVVFGNACGPWHLVSMFVAVFALIVFIIGRALKNENKVRAAQRQFRFEHEVVMDGTYRCVAPQVLDSMVVFPVKVTSRDAEADSIVVLTDEALVVEFSQGGKVGPPVTYRDGDDGLRQRELTMKKREHDTVDRLTKLISAAISIGNNNASFEIKVFSGSGSGPTGLAAGVLCPDYGPTLAAFVGTSLEKVARPVSPPPVQGGIGAKIDNKKAD